MPKSNVHPDHYKIAGRERQGEDILQKLEKRTLSQAQSHHAGQRMRLRKQGESSGEAPAQRKLPLRQPNRGALDRNRFPGTRHTRNAGGRGPRKRTR